MSVIDPQRTLIEDIASYSLDPLAFVRYAFPWGEPGPLEAHDGPDAWQRDILCSVRDGLLTSPEAIRMAVASGHGVGKSSLVAWLVLWAMCSHEDTRGVVTANTENQLRTKTWAELAKWYRLLICRHWFQLTPTAIHARAASHEKTWRIDMVPWSERNTEAFAGLHNAGKRLLAVFDEASAIPDVIWETTEGALTDADTQIIWLAFGNPTRNTGRFRECFGRFRHRWLTRQIDSRTAKMTNKVQLKQWVDDYGEDSDFVRVRVRGVFPRAGSMQFIDGDVVDAARLREPVARLHDPLVIGVDVARQGDDQTVIYCRKGRDAASFPVLKLRVADLMAIAAKVHDLATSLAADAVFVDGSGIGAGVVDRLRQLRLPGLYEVQFGGKADRGQGDATARYANKRAEMWGTMRDWLRTGSIPNDPELISDLTGVEFALNMRDEIQLERKEHMKERGLSSPDVADALALTFAYPVSPSIMAGGPAMMRQSHIQHDYNPLEAY